MHSDIEIYRNIYKFAVMKMKAAYKQIDFCKGHTGGGGWQKEGTNGVKTGWMIVKKLEFTTRHKQFYTQLKGGEIREQLLFYQQESDRIVNETGFSGLQRCSR